ncbi:thioredoxin domain-containing protein 16 isoform X1 [Gopherus evgoodei]|uniref:Thioredoxin domain containing 16 n=2 Tax=Gopherus evgoodei TaxID=1825980 RepID=A0A8C4VJ03_9SAUR|nr:thioredoxin domain-containing protein 16 isoform X1 [Gopherus evgoodei]XP_030418743.1 thioredoxin domain-containing protein 16 isoform X1 [Gopherus evgoodei]XP_030418744.1 thioredoxin domain-containing protein 16 isoform X1 [Gopherus evgoodei]XP_030418745.1 thioredoxin domain-containing protein 16 isoform X1 [Gopherus evgoodei]XP_030418746.1 thioredoxin domain-containing protein 16 isoform X1 [Gopherus evgoodei]XP_030418747.1 thioredoxin domain-containing protein 16 isoform X1 [Gopherus evg
MLPQENGWVSCFSFLLLGTYSMAAARNANTLLELSPREYFSSLQPGRASLVYFSRDDSPGVRLFLEQLENSVGALQDYGISVVKVNCLKEDVSRYCGKENALMKAYLFRDNILLREFPTDALFDVNAIVANTLFALLFNEVKYITTLVELQNLENSLKGRSNVVFAYVPAVGTPEHRAVMEAAFVYGTAHQFVLTTEAALAKDFGHEDFDALSAQLFFCHCQRVPDLTQPCRRTPMVQSLTTLNIHTYLKLMAAPIVTEVAEDPEKVSTIHLQLGLPLVFILSQQETYESDKRTAEFVAWQLLGKAGVALLSRDSIDLNVLLRSNIALKTAEEGAPIKYLVLEDTDEIVALVEDKIKGEQIPEDEDESDNNDQDIQDDQVMEAVYRDRKRELPLELIRTLTEETFNAALTETAHMVVLFYASWEAVSLAMLQLYVEVAVALKGTQGISLAKVNCWDWPDVCMKQNVTQFPITKMYEKGARSLTYTGMLGTAELLRFLRLSSISCPAKLTTIEEVDEYLTGEVHADSSSYHSTPVLGIFHPSMKEARETFVEAGNMLRGYVTTGLYAEDDALILAHKYAVPLPALLLARREDHRIDSIPLSKQSAPDVVQTIRSQLLETFPEITVENLPDYLSLEKPLLILFNDRGLNQSMRMEMLSVVNGKGREAFLACWMNLKNTPVGRGVLKAYFSTPPPLPLLAWVNRHSSGQVFSFPSDQPVTETNVLSWLEKLKAGLEIPSATLSDEAWKPPLPAYNFLRMMEATLPKFTVHTVYSRGGTDELQQAEEVLEEKSTVREEQVEEPGLEAEEGQSPGRDLRGTVPRLAGREKSPKQHTEL